VTSELEIWRAATLVLDQHGNEALAVAEARGQALLDQADIDGWTRWMRIAAAVLERQTQLSRTASR